MVKSFISIYVSPAGTLRFPYGNRKVPAGETYGLRTRNLKNIFAYSVSYTHLRAHET